MDTPPPAGSAPAWHVSGTESGRELVRGFAFAALVLAYGADASLDPREVDTMAEGLYARFPTLSGDDIIEAVRDATRRYSAATVEEALEDVIRLGDRLPEAGRRAFFSDLVAVADADGVVHQMESTILRNIATAWGLADEAE